MAKKSYSDWLTERRQDRYQQRFESDKKLVERNRRQWENSSAGQKAIDAGFSYANHIADLRRSNTGKGKYAIKLYDRFYGTTAAESAQPNAPETPPRTFSPLLLVSKPTAAKPAAPKQPPVLLRTRKESIYAKAVNQQTAN